MDTMVEQRNNHDSCLVDHIVVLDDLPENLIFDILVRLPLETLCSSRLVCKSWFEIINSHDFRTAHLRRSEKTTTRGLIFFTPAENNLSPPPPPPPKKVFSVEFNSMLDDHPLSLHLKFMEFNDGKSTMKDYNATFRGMIVATCNGLIVLKENYAGTRLIILNPITRELEDIPLGTISYSGHDLYGLAFCHVSRRYKLLHLFKKYRIGCEIMDVGSGSWRAVDVPSTVRCYMLLNPVFAMGALHWKQYDVDHGECMGSIPLDDEKFKTMAFPETGGSYCDFNSIFAMGEFLGFAEPLQRPDNLHHLIGVWILRGLGGECSWEKQYNIDVSSSRMGYNMTTLLCYGGVNGESFIFKCGDGCLYAYDLDRHSQPLRKIPTIDINFWKIFPHVNSLASWRNLVRSGEHN